MSFDNRQFNINGEMDDYESFKSALTLAFKQDDCASVQGYKIDTERGLVLARYEPSKEFTRFPCPMDVAAVANFVWAWLKSGPKINSKGWDATIDHDGDDGAGWRIYCEDWGHVETSSAFIAIRPIVCWYGK